MAVLQMNKICICAVKKDRKRILEYLQRQGCVEIYDTEVTDGVFTRENTASVCTTLKKSCGTACDCTTALDQYCPEKKSMIGFLKGRKTATVEQSEDFYHRKDKVLQAAHRILHLDRGIAEARAEIFRLEAQEEALLPWMKLPVPQTFKGTKNTAVYIGSVEGEYTLPGLLELFAGASSELEIFHAEIVSSSKIQTCFYLLVLKADAAKAETALRAVGFSAPVSPSHHMPLEKKERILKQKQEAQDVIDQAEREIRSYESMREDFRFLEDHMRMRDEKYEVIERLLQSKHTFVLNGYIAAQDSDRLQREMEERFDCAIHIESAGNDENVPVKLHNNKFAAPIESVIESYSLPSIKEIDPAPVMSIFYYFMFGLMFSDAGYGFIVAACCGAALLFYKDMEPNWKRNLSMFFWCGVSTLFWGVVFSGYFGDAITVISKTFFGHEVTIPPLWFAPLDKPMLLLVFCLGIGVVHLTTGYIIKALNLFRSKAYIDIVYDAVFPLAILLCLLPVLMGSDMFLTMAGFKLVLSATVVNILMGTAFVCMVGVLLTGGRESRNWFKRLLKGAYALYNVLAGWISDILSYSRLLALGLATGVIASVFNSLGALGGSSVLGVLVFLFAFAVGHVLNFGINILGAYVHSNRLEYVEFFSKFYEGGGRKFLPFGMHTKHYRIVEED
jgi:V/A-type H+-transporting ATPase subunit I